MTSAKRLRQFGGRIDTLAKAFENDIPNADSNIEVVLYGIRDLIEHQIAVDPGMHELQRQCLESMIEDLQNAAFNYHASWK